MSQEIELKLTICQEAVSAFRQLSVLNVVESQRFELSNTYFDTQDQQLTRSGAALRIRRFGQKYIQTLKTRGQNIGGLHQRNEWEFPISGPTLDFSLFPSDSPTAELDESDVNPLFQTNFVRERWLLNFQSSQIEVVLDSGRVEAGESTDPISELELELKQGSLIDLFDLASLISSEVAVMPSDMSKAERGYRLVAQQTDFEVALPNIAPQQSMESAFCALFGYELERLQRGWQVFWSTHQWRHLQGFLNTLGNMEAEIEWFQGLLPTEQIRFVHEQLDWMTKAIQPILSWWPACFELSQDAEQEPKTVAVSLQQSKAQKAIKALDALRMNPELGHRMLSLTAWLHSSGWHTGQSAEHRHLAETPVVDGIDFSFDRAFRNIDSDCFAGSASHALSQSPAVHRLLMLCHYFDHLYGEQLGHLRAPLEAMNDSLSRLSAMDVVARLKDWLNELPQEQQASVHSWARSQPVLLRDIKRLANKLVRGREHLSGGAI
ncbi:inorganic triphosphatase [Reinekea blandensis]|nr:CYTH domain-containing protein [Reinekea blandensis]